MNLSPQIIRDFREKMNEHEIIQIYRDHDGRDEWNVICSAIDWIETAVYGVDSGGLSRANSNAASIRMITFISCVDILWRSVCQLHRVFVDRKTLPFKDDYSVFHSHCSDNVQFETIRAIFAAHPVDLKNVFGGGNDERWFASWSGGTFSRSDFGVFLYSSKPGVSSVPFDISFSEVFEFARKRYEYLIDLANIAGTKIDEYNNHWKAEKIVADQSDVLSWINVLLKENRRRGDIDFIKYDLEKAREAFETVPGCEKNRTVLEAYRKALISQLIEIQNALQEMCFENVYEVEGELPEKYQYPASKLFADDDPMFFYGVDSIQEYLTGIVDLYRQHGVAEIQSVARAGIWYKDHVK